MIWGHVRGANLKLEGNEIKMFVSLKGVKIKEEKYMRFLGTELKGPRKLEADENWRKLSRQLRDLEWDQVTLVNVSLFKQTHLTAYPKDVQLPKTHYLLLFEDFEEEDFIGFERSFSEHEGVGETLVACGNCLVVCKCYVAPMRPMESHTKLNEKAG